MSKKKGEIDLKAIMPLVRKSAYVTLRYSGIMFFVLVAAVYSFVLLRINTLSTAQPTGNDISTQTKTSSVPAVNPTVIKQIQALKDNSSNVQTLFQQARDNPFQE